MPENVRPKSKNENVLKASMLISKSVSAFVSE